jgi:hypothetical protein
MWNQSRPSRAGRYPCPREGGRPAGTSRLKRTKMGHSGTENTKEVFIRPSFLCDLCVSVAKLFVLETP